MWVDAQTTSIQFDLSTFGEGDRFSNPLVVDFTDPAVDTIAGVESINIKRGRDDNLEAFGMGTCSIVINDPTGRYNPANEAGVLYGKLRPMRQVQVQATLSGQTVSLFRGYIRNIDYRAELMHSTATLTVSDLFLYMNRVKPSFVNQGRDTTTGEAFSQMLSAALWDTTILTSLQTGDVIPSPGVSNTTAEARETALGIVQNLMEIERGDFYISSNGTVTFKQRNDKATRLTSATFNNVSGYAVASSDIERVKNKAAVARATGNPVVPYVTSEWSDGTSIANYGQQDFSTIQSPYLYDSTQALALAQWLVSQRASPLVVFRAIELTARALQSAGALYALLTELSDRISVANTSIGSSAIGYFVEGIEHSITPGNHKIKYSLIPIIAGAFVLDSALSGILDTNALAY